ncbi:MAG: hypothetical protein IJM15_04260 [Erysipelotrichaceae bacterium]|nr:hypothetical protein [Erysipelotrichaceae bacterium]
MVMITYPNINRLIEEFDGHTVQGINFKLVKKSGIQAIFEHDAESDEACIKAIKPYLKKHPVYGQMVCNIMAAIK